VVQQVVASSIPVNSTVIAPAANEMLIQQMKALEEQKKRIESTEVWQGKSKSTTTPTSLGQSSLYSSRPSYSPTFVKSPTSTTLFRPRGFNNNSSSVTTKAAKKTQHRPFLSPNGQSRSSTLSLVVKPESRLRMTTPRTRLKIEIPPIDSIDQVPKEDAKAPLHTSPPGVDNVRSPQDAHLAPTAPAKSPGYDYYQQVVGAATPSKRPHRTPDLNSRTSAVPKLTKEGYEVDPSMEDLQMMSEADLAAVPKFSISRGGYGKVEWEGSVDVRGADLDSIVYIEHRSVDVYSNEERDGVKPAMGTKLNRPAIVTCYNVYPKEKGAGASEEEKTKFATVVARKMSKMDAATLISYNKDTGVWQFRVEHFSKYSLDDSDEDEEQYQAGDSLPSKRKIAKMAPSSGAKYGKGIYDLHQNNVVSDTESIDLENSLQPRNYAIIPVVKKSTRRPVASLLSYYTGKDEIAQRKDRAKVFGPLLKSDRKSSLLGVSDLDRGLVHRQKPARAVWARDGSVISISLSGKLNRERPMLSETKSYTALLNVHYDNRTMSPMEPVFYQGSQTKAMFPLLECREVTTCRQALKLLLSLDDPKESTKARVLAFLASEKRRLLPSTTSVDPLDSIFDSLSVGSREEAIGIAIQAQLFDLASSIASSQHGRPEVSTSLSDRKDDLLACDRKLLRIYKAIAGDLTYENNLFRGGDLSLSWHCRLAMRLWQQDHTSIESILQEFGADVDKGRVPAPKSCYSDDDFDVVYKMIQLLDGKSYSITKAAAPSGYSDRSHDYCDAFFLVSVASLVFKDAAISDYEAESIVDSFASQLCAIGEWKWAIYVTLSSLTDAVSPKLTESKKRRAHGILLRFFAGNEDESKDFLVDGLRIPQPWLEEIKFMREQFTAPESVPVSGQARDGLKVAELYFHNNNSDFLYFLEKLQPVAGLDSIFESVVQALTQKLKMKNAVERVAALEIARNRLHSLLKISNSLKDDEAKKAMVLSVINEIDKMQKYDHERNSVCNPVLF